MTVDAIRHSSLVGSPNVGSFTSSDQHISIQLEVIVKRLFVYLDGECQSRQWTGRDDVVHEPKLSLPGFSCSIHVAEAESLGVPRGEKVKTALIWAFLRRRRALQRRIGELT